MTRLDLVGLRADLPAVLEVLHRQAVLHLVDMGDASEPGVSGWSTDDEEARAVDELRHVEHRLRAMLHRAPDAEPVAPPAAPDVAALRTELDALAPVVEGHLHTIDALAAELELLPHHLHTTRRLLPLVPQLAELQRYEMVALLLDVRHEELLEPLEQTLAEVADDNYVLVWERTDESTVGAVLVFPKEASRAVHELLGSQRVSQARLPEAYRNVPMREAVAAMEQRLAALPGELADARRALDALLAPNAGRYLGLLGWVEDRLEQAAVLHRLAATERSFLMRGWVPERAVDELLAALAAEVGQRLAVTRTAPERDDPTVPVQLSNPPGARSFEFLVRMFAVPSYHGIDPTPLLALFMPLFFGLMLGDVGYGLVLAAVAGVLRWRLPAWRPLASVLLFGAAWSVAFGVAFGELFGDLGHHVGLHPLLFHRQEAVRPLLFLAVAVGVGHVVLSLGLGTVLAARSRDWSELGERLGKLVVLCALMGLAGALIGLVPAALLRPSVALLVVGTAVLMASGGAFGLLLGPLEVLGVVSTVLSYLRLAALGLASVYLAYTANQLGATTPAVVGVLLAVLFHTLNFALGAFSPTVQALRLHYVEHFGGFYTGGGVPYQPLGTRS